MCCTNNKSLNMFLQMSLIIVRKNCLQIYTLKFIKWNNGNFTYLNAITQLYRLFRFRPMEIVDDIIIGTMFFRRTSRT